MSAETDRPPKLRMWDVFILGLSIYVLAGLAAQTFLPISEDVSLIIDRLDAWVCLVFLTDFSVRLARSPRKLAFLKWGWIDLLASIPAWDAFRLGRVFRLVRIFRVLRGIRSAKTVAALFFSQRAKGSFALAGLAAVFLLVSGAIAVLHFEAASEHAYLRNGSDALWWACTTMTTVGYGDFVPVTTGGRVVGVILMTAGVGLFGILSGFVATWFIEGDRDADTEVTLESLKDDLDEVKRLLRDRRSS